MLKQQHYTLTNVKKSEITINHPFNLKNFKLNKTIIHMIKLILTEELPVRRRNDHVS